MHVYLAYETFITLFFRKLIILLFKQTINKERYVHAVHVARRNSQMAAYANILLCSEVVLLGRTNKGTPPKKKKKILVLMIKKVLYEYTGHI